MREATVKSDLVESSGAETFEAMFDKEVSVQLSKRNMMGVADMLVQAQSRQMSPPPSTDELLKSRDTVAKGFALNPSGKAYSLDAAAPMLNPLKRPGGPFALPRIEDLSTRSKP
jgi:Rod binding domain-containing protein